MSSVQVNFKMDSKIKNNAQKVAAEIGVSLSDVWNSCVREFIRKKSITFSASEEPSDFLLKAIADSEEDIRKGRLSPAFDNAKDAIKWLNKPDKKSKKK
jgi:addiction module RelB/DinJ family antitoxin